MHLQRSQELFRRARLRSAAVVLVLVGLVAACTPTGGGGGPNLQQVAGPASTPLEVWSTAIAYGQLGAAETSTNYVPNKPYGEIGGPWCANFITWVLRSSNIDPAGSGRGSFNTNVARAWSIYGPKGGGYGRMGTAHDAMPGDLLIKYYNGTDHAGGHISMVIGNASADGRWVWTVGGNEGDAVRLQRKDLNADSHYLVTLSEFRHPVSILKQGDTPRGFVFQSRFTGGFGPLLHVDRVVDNAGQDLSGAALQNSGYRIVATERGTGATKTFPADTTISTINYTAATLELHGALLGNPDALWWSVPLTQPSLSIDVNRSSNGNGETD